ncbi:MAG: DUF3267 domain-containing protein [Ardenticatenaceae bacterium]|nr:DUF3267 domain-containing protein [Ardenticatenaceae bacterium]
MGGRTAPGVLGVTSAGVILAGAAGLVLLLAAHEAIHGACFVLFGHRPRFRFRGGMLFVEVGYGLLARDEYLVVLLTPLVLLTGAGLVALAWGPPLLAPLVASLLIINAVGAAGDLVAAGLLLRVPRRALLQQTPGGLCVYHYDGQRRPL